MWAERPSCHDSDPFANNLRRTEWDVRNKNSVEYEACSYCGSISAKELMKLLTDGATMSGSDWKYGWPHKFYINTKDKTTLKFYSQHLTDIIDQPEFSDLSEMIYEKTGDEYSPKVLFVNMDGRLYFVSTRDLGITYDEVIDRANKGVDKADDQNC